MSGESDGYGMDNAFGCVLFGIFCVLVFAYLLHPLWLPMVFGK